jgi:exodeoxyribonuclease VII small subunit
MAKKTFESALARLESITDELEEGEIGLEKSLKKFDEGIALIEFCSRKLEEARTRVDLLVNKDKRLASEPFEENTSQD